VYQIQHRRLELDIPEPVQRLPDRADHRGPGCHHRARLGPHDEVEVRIAHPGFFAERLVGDRQWAQRLGGDAPVVGQHRQLAALGRDHLAVHEHDVAQVDVGLPGSQGRVSELNGGEHDLQLDAVLAQRGEAEPARVAHEDDATGDAHVRTGRRLCGEIGVGRAHLSQGVTTGNHDREGRTLRISHQPVVLGSAHPKLLGQLLGARLFGHRRQSIGPAGAVCVNRPLRASAHRPLAPHLYPAGR
jgi:hypothetical protein